MLHSTAGSTRNIILNLIACRRVSLLHLAKLPEDKLVESQLWSTERKIIGLYFIGGVVPVICDRMIPDLIIECSRERFRVNDRPFDIGE